MIAAAVEVRELDESLKGPRWFARCVNCGWESNLYHLEWRAAERARLHLEHKHPLESPDGEASRGA